MKRRGNDEINAVARQPRPLRVALLCWAAVFVVAVILTGAAAASPRYLRDMDTFRVERVEVVGTHFMPPDQALAATGITRKSSVFDDPARWRRNLLRHALVRDVRIERSLPATLRIIITESNPVALVPTPELRAVDARGKLLPIDLSGTPLDLPLLAQLTGIGPNGAVSNADTRLLLAELNRLRILQPALAARVSELVRIPDAFKLVLRDPAGAEAILSPDADAQRLAEVELALTDLAARNELGAVSRIDARFTEQVVVALEQARVVPAVSEQPPAADAIQPVAPPAAVPAIVRSRAEVAKRLAATTDRR